MPTSRKAPLVTIVSVCYNSSSVLQAMLASCPKGAAEIVLVDNASQDDEALAELAAEYGAHLIQNTDNQGFGVACNQGAQAASGQYLLFLNPDATLMPDTLDKLLAAARAYPNASAMNPRIEDDDGAIVFKRHSYLMPKSQKMPRGCPEADQEVTVLSGAALFVSRQCFEAVGGFDPQIFLYHEDDDLSRRLRAECGPLMFVRDAIVRHQGDSSSAPSAAITALKAYNMARSRVYAVRKHDRPLPFLSTLYSALRKLLSLKTLSSSALRAERMAYLRGVLSTLADGGRSEGAAK